MSDPNLYYLCIHCERAFLKSECRQMRFMGVSVGLCAHEDCDGHELGDCFEWANVRLGREDRYPVDPVRGTVYPLYDDVVGKWLKSRRHTDRCDAAGCENFVGLGEGWVYRFDSGLEFCRHCAEGSSGTIRDGLGPVKCYVIGSPPTG